MQNQLRIIVTGADAGQRLDKVLAAAPGIGSRAEAQKLIEAGPVLVDGRPRSKNYRVREGEAIVSPLPRAEAPVLEPEEMNLRTPFEDEYLLVVDKPAGLVTHPAKGHPRGTLVHGLLAHQIRGGESPHRPGIVHRLDKDTSGLLIVARDEETHRRLTGMLKRRAIERTYLALAHGRFETREGTVEAPLARDASRRQKMAVDGRRGREAVTHFRVLRSWPGPGSAAAAGKAPEDFSLLEIKLETGRTHQIRVHLAAIGHPLAGDRTYGRKRDVLGIGRQFLHSARLKFRHPVTGEELEIESPLPEDLKAALESLSRDSETVKATGG
ncbi:MAG: RluA family pseudouridine synthase [Thermoleophilia bacterium]|nr:RluA family pseudouridine synthase [Thermoleophilia bacterium]